MKLSNESLHFCINIETIDKVNITNNDFKLWSVNLLFSTLRTISIISSNITAKYSKGCAASLSCVFVLNISFKVANIGEGDLCLETVGYVLTSYQNIVSY